MPLMRGLEDLDALAMLVSVVELGSLSQAGARHGVSQPAASSRLARLEAKLGLALIERSPTGCTPTPAGAALVEWSRDLLAHAGRIDGAVHALKETAQTVSLAASLTIAEQLLPFWLAELRIARDDIRIRVTVANSAAVVGLVRDGHVGLGFIETSAPVVGLNSRTVATDRLVVVVGSAHPWRRRRTSLQPGQLADTPLVLREPGSGTRATLEMALTNVGWALCEPVLELASTAAVRNAVAAGVAPTVISALAVAEDVAAGRLHIVAVTGLDLDRPFLAVWKGTPPALLGWLERIAARST
jgi:DNA-binding transcriptional LysR family regulator